MKFQLTIHERCTYRVEFDAETLEEAHEEARRIVEDSEFDPIDDFIENGEREWDLVELAETVP